MLQWVASSAADYVVNNLTLVKYAVSTESCASTCNRIRSLRVIHGPRASGLCLEGKVDNRFVICADAVHHELQQDREEHCCLLQNLKRKSRVCADRFMTSFALASMNAFAFQ